MYLVVNNLVEFVGGEKSQGKEDHQETNNAKSKRPLVFLTDPNLLLGVAGSSYVIKLCFQALDLIQNS